MSGTAWNVLSLYAGPVVAVMGHLMVCRPNARSVGVCLLPVVNCDKMVQPDIDLLGLAQRLAMECDAASWVLAFFALSVDIYLAS